MNSLLLVEDDISLGETLQERLQRESYRVTWAQSLTDADQALLNGSFQLIILDVGLPDGSGFELAKKIRAQQNIPFIFMTAMNTAENRLEGYEIGAEEFIPKPFHLKELLLRVKHVLATHAVPHRVYAGEMIIDLDSMSIQKADGSLSRPTARDFQLLKYLVLHAPRVVSRDEILEGVWGEDKYPSTRTVDNAIVRLRQDLNDVDGVWIRSIRGIGYQWAGEVRRE